MDTQKSEQVNSNKIVRKLALKSVNILGQGMEELLTEQMSTIGRALTYMSDRDIMELLDKHLEVSDRDIDNRWDGRYKITPAPIRCRGVLLFAFCQGNDDVNTFLNA